MKVYFSLNKEVSGFKKDIKQLYNLALKETKMPDNLCVNLALVSDAKIKKLNNEYRNVDRVTDVLSFPMIDNFENLQNEPDFALGQVNIGDIYINLQRAKQQAQEYGHSLKREFCFLALHGLLHLLGYDHIEKKDEKQMTALQNIILEKANIGRN